MSTMDEDAVSYAKKYIEDILSFFGLNTDVQARQAEDRVIELSVPSTHLNGFLIGQRGDTLRSLQFMVNTALRAQGHDDYRVSLDIADYKRHRQDRLAEQVEKWVDEVKKSGEAMELRPMNAADRRVVHQVVGEDSKVTSESLGEGRDRRVVIAPTALELAEDIDDEEELTDE